MNPLDIQIIVNLVFLLLAVLAIASMVLAYFSAAPWCPTKKRDLDRIIKAVDIKNGEIVYEFGSGTGRVAIYLAKKTSAKVIGLEISWPFFLISKARNLLTGNSNIKFKLKNFFNQNISDADYIFCYINPRGLEKLGDKFKKELKSGAKVISYIFKISNWEPIVVDRDEGGGATIYVYQK